MKSEIRNPKSEIRNRWAVALSLLLAAAVSGCSTHVLQRPVERRLQRRLVTLIGPAQHYSVRISRTDDDDLVLGRIGHLEVVGEGVRIGGRLPVERLEMRLDRVRYSGAPVELVSIGRGELVTEFAEAALNQYLARYHPREEIH